MGRKAVILVGTIQNMNHRKIDLIFGDFERIGAKAEITKPGGRF